MRCAGLIICLFLLVAACRQKKDIPPNILPQKKMQELVFDLMRADQFLGNYLLNSDSSLDKTAESLKYYQRVFLIHQVTREQFNESFAYYRAHPVLFKAILDSISAPEQASLQEAQPVPAMTMPDTGKEKVKEDTPAFRKKTPALPD